MPSLHPAALCLCASLGSVASAAPVELIARGDDGAGSMFELLVYYESSTPPSNPIMPGDTSAIYPGLISATAWVDGVVQVDIPAPDDFGIFRSVGVFDDSTHVPTGDLFDGIGILASDQSTDPLGVISLVLRDFDADSHNGLALPTSLDLADYEDRVFDVTSADDGSNLRFEVTFLQARIVPAPGSAACLLPVSLLLRRPRRR